MTCDLGGGVVYITDLGLWVITIFAIWGLIDIGMRLQRYVQRKNYALTKKTEGGKK